MLIVSVVMPKSISRLSMKIQSMAWFVTDIYYSKVGAVSWVQNWTSQVYGQS